MKTILALPLLAAGLSACQIIPPRPYDPSQGPAPYPQPYPYPQPSQPPAAPAADTRYHAVGTEPFWDLTIGHDMLFTDRGTGVQIAEQAPPVQHGIAGEIYRGGRLDVNIVHAKCSDGMSDRIYPDTVTVQVEGRPYKGCGGSTFPAASAPIAPREMVFNLANTHWRVLSINGERVPAAGFGLDFARDRLSGKLGCNMLGAGYRVRGQTLTAGAMIMTRMACGNSRLETSGAAILGEPMTITGRGTTIKLTNLRGSIEMVRTR